jgi:formate-dependent nitrite reductase membrane component NrfD
MLAAEGKLPVIGFLYKLLPERLLVGLGIPSSFMLAGYTGVLLGTTSIPVWYTSPLLGGLFMSSALTTGAAATALVASMSGREDAEEHHTLASLSLALGTAEIAVLGGYVATSGAAARPLLRGAEGAMLAGAAASLALAALLDLINVRSAKGSRTAGIAANVAALAGGALLRWAIVRAGRVSAADRDGTLEAMRPRAGSPGWGSPQG